MTAVERVIRRARRRVAVDKALHVAGRGLVIGAATALVLLALDRGAGLPVPVFAYPLLAGAGLLLALALGMTGRPPGLATAVHLDRALGLKDRIGTAESIRQGRTRGELADLARLQAERLAETIDVRRATPIRIDRIWAAALILSLLLGAGVAFLPDLGPRSRTATTTTSPRLAEHRTEIVETISDAVADLDPETLDPESRQDVETLEALARQLADETATEIELADARDQSAAQLEQVADRLAEQAQRNLDAVEEVTRRFDGIEVPEQAAAPTEALADALREGDLEEAADRFDELMDSGEAMTPDEREQVARELREIGDQLETPPDDRNPPEQADEIRDALKDLGLDEQTARELLEQMDPEAVERALEAQDLDPEAMRQLADDLDRLREQEDMREQADEQQRHLAEAFEDAAKQMDPQDVEPTDPQPHAEQQTPPEAPPEPQPEQQQEQPGREREEPGPSQQRQQEPQQQPQEQPGEQPGQPQERPGQTTREVPREGGAERQQTRQEVPQQVPDQGPQPGPPQELPGPGEETGEQSGEPQPRQPSVSEALREMQRMRSRGEDRQQDSERLRQAARELADSLSEQEKRELAERWLDQQDPGPGGSRVGSGLLDEQPPDGPPPFETIEDVDLRPQDADQGRIIAEWLGPEGGEGDPALPARGRARARAAQTEAERAVEKAVVPSRYSTYIQRYFGRLEETVDKAAGEGAPAREGDS